MAETERLDKILAGTGRWSRRDVRDLVCSGRVTADGIVVRSAKEHFSPAAAFAVDGTVVTGLGFSYVMLYKPAGTVSATTDRTYQTVIDLMPEELRRVGLSPAGRLDRDSEGLLLLTNDGPLCHRLISPRWHVDKVYFIRTDGPLDDTHAAAFAGGMVLENGERCRPAGLERLQAPNEALVTLQEGKFHQIKRMIQVLGLRVVFLKRIAMGPLTLDPALAPGAWRRLTADEIQDLKESAELG